MDGQGDNCTGDSMIVRPNQETGTVLTQSLHTFFPQCFLFFLAGFDTTSTMLTFLTYELCVNPDIQQKLREEIIETHENLGGKRISYETLQKMKYLDQVVSESLRKWPPVGIIDRLCVKDYLCEYGDGAKFLIEKGVALWIPIYGLHHDPSYFPKPDQFDPERFSDDNRSDIVPGSYLPFGIGPRNCIGEHFLNLIGEYCNANDY